jgi:hypothetical protein
VLPGLTHGHLCHVRIVQQGVDIDESTSNQPVRPGTQTTR